MKLSSLSLVSLWFAAMAGEAKAALTETFDFGSGVSAREEILVGDPVDGVVADGASVRWQAVQGRPSFGGSPGSRGAWANMNLGRLGNVLRLPYSFDEETRVLSRWSWTPGSEGVRGIYMGLEAAVPDDRLLINQRSTDSLFIRVFPNGTIEVGGSVEGFHSEGRKRVSFSEGDKLELCLSLDAVNRKGTAEVGNTTEGTIASISFSWEDESPAWSHLAFNVTGQADVALLREARVEEPNSSVEKEQPNVLWLMMEDFSVQVGSYGDPDAITPNLDGLAADGIRFANAFSHAPVSAPARTTLITGMSPVTTGGHQMRSKVRIGDRVPVLPAILSGQGFFNLVNKRDFNLDTPYAWPRGWDAALNIPMSAAPQTFRDAAEVIRERAGGQPFFAMYSLGRTHQSQYGYPNDEEAYHQQRCTRLQPAQYQSRGQVRLPPFYPDVPATREYWAQYLEAGTEVDAQIGDVLEVLAENGWEEDTILFVFGDNGMGARGGKGLLYEEGLRVPFFVHVPEKWRPSGFPPDGSVLTQLVSFEDFAPTLLSLLDLPVPEAMQGQPFFGPEAEPRRYVFGIRDRIGTWFDPMRSVRDERFLYIRRLLPHLRGVEKAYSVLQAPALLTEFQRAIIENRLPEGRLRHHFLLRPPEELYDLQADPWQQENLADDPAFQADLERLRGALHTWMIESRDLGLLPELEMRRLAGNGPVLELGNDPQRFPLERLLGLADRVASAEPSDLEAFRSYLDSSDAAVRWWAVQGLTALGESARPALLDLQARLEEDEAPEVRLAAGEALCLLGRKDLAFPAMAEELRCRGDNQRIKVAQSYHQRLGGLAAEALPAFREIVRDRVGYVTGAAVFAETFGRALEYENPDAWWAERIIGMREFYLPAARDADEAMRRLSD
ncbi:sulfatase-like hydrolase/transferase [Kiritimatiella glycovorans]|uniref:Arylsulfatase n=1 Tax=Kiritimatiella glycovorans TaxID=1307763 RepID=A0A0G3EJN2_9BACT|nr:sulfatase-like hydrolase/transferase [Kiritimatiella glycovorans]AKJ64334.1 Arylsulfatase [Kiritimatiella glycovorans]